MDQRSALEELNKLIGDDEDQAHDRSGPVVQIEGDNNTVHIGDDNRGGGSGHDPEDGEGIRYELSNMRLELRALREAVISDSSGANRVANYPTQQPESAESIRHATRAANELCAGLAASAQALIKRCMAGLSGHATRTARATILPKIPLYLAIALCPNPPVTAH